MKIVYLLIGLPIAALLYIGISNLSNLQTDGIVLLSVLFSIFTLIPGVLALVWSRLNHVKIPFFPIKSRYLIASFFGGTAIGALSFFMAQYFSSPSVNETATSIFGSANFILFYFVPFLSFFFFLLVGEICWRGYLWEKWKAQPMKGALAIWLLWTLWGIPSAVAFSTNIFLMAFVNFSFMPLLHFFREKSQSIIPGTLFYASISSSYLCLMFFFPVNQIQSVSLIQGAILLIVGLAAVYPRHKAHKQCN